MQGVLPTQCRDFMNKQYWQRFFKKIKKEGQQNEFFEWYGNYDSYNHLFKKYIKMEDNVFHAGCGKSLLSEQLYDNGICKNITNVDYEKISLDQMRKRSENKRPEMSFQCMSLTEEINIQSEQFDVILDKGTLDAIFPDEETPQVNTYLANMLRILKKNGKFIIISLLQEHILKTLLQLQVNIQIYECIIEKSKLYPFFIVIDKSDQKSIQFYQLQKEVQILSIKQAQEIIKKIQLQNHFVTSIHKLRQSQSFTLDIWDNNNKQTPRYKLDIYDNDDSKILLQKTCGCFIVPQGREQSFLFGTEQGHKELIKQMKMSRCVIARMNPGHKFNNMKQVQQELSEPMKQLIPKGCTNIPCPFLTDGDEIGEKNIIFEADDCIVEELNIDDIKYRRLIIKSALDLIQSEAKIINNKVDNSYLDFEAYVAIVAGLAFNKAKEVLILGGGVGLLSRFINEHFGVKVTNIELSEDIVNVAKTFFDFKNTDSETLVCCDALDYVDQTLECHQYDTIIVDINASQANQLSPPKQFLSTEFLNKLKTLLTPQGIIIINVLDSQKELTQLPWDLYYSRKCENEINEIFYLINAQKEKKQIDGKEIDVIDKGLLDSITQQLKESRVNFSKGKWDNSMNLANEIDNIKLKHPVFKTQAFQTQDALLVQDGEIINNRKEFYQEDLKKVQKKKHNRRRKN
ncbi:unnamed protein product [Paramecium primaurelia]|uniref:Methyltransferase domain-containing protein n=1 Tax=Paramecium primaurelia TaxID=5886 RepID=A0A8S1L0P8_PARPR|nr:unnamed protein product [Paramecium primaurelia]